MASDLLQHAVSAVPVAPRSDCRGCHSTALELSVPLAQVPIVSPNVGGTGQELAHIVAPLDLYLCRDCGLIQLIHVVDPGLIYRNYLYRTAVSKGLSEHFAALAQTAVARLGLARGARVVEFGSNDGTLLSHFQATGMSVQGVDPAQAIAAEATSRGIPTWAEFFDVQTAEALIADGGRANLIVSNNVMANIDDLDPIVDGVRILMAPGGAYVFETQYALDVFEKTLLDVIYHEHISCFSVRPVVELFARAGLEVFDAERIATKGGSIRFWVQHAGGPHAVSPQVADLADQEDRAGLYDRACHRRFAERIAAIRAEIHAHVAETKSHGGKVAAWGTSVGCAALVHQFALEDKIDVFLDDQPFKDRLAGPGYDLPVMTGTAGRDAGIALVIMLAWRYADMIVGNHPQYFENGSRFLVPLPEARLL